MKTQSRRAFLIKTSLGPPLLAFAGYGAARQLFAEQLPERNWRHVSWESIRDEFAIDEDIAYLNTGTLGACPRSVMQRVCELWRDMETNPAEIGFGPLQVHIQQVRDKAARLLNAETDEIILTSNTTEGMNLVASSFPWQQGDEIVTTDHEHPGGSVGWEFAAMRHQLKITRVPLRSGMDNPVSTPEQLATHFISHLSDRTRLVSLSHVLFTTGLRMPVAAIAAAAHQRGIAVVVDGAQAPGMIELDVKRLDVDAYASSSHKWLLAPKGSGLLYLSKAFQTKLHSVFLHSGNGAYTAATGTRNFPAMVGHGLAIDFMAALGLSRIERRTLELTELLGYHLAEISGIRLARPLHPGLNSAMLSFIPISRGNDELKNTLWQKYRIVVKAVPRLNAIRVSTHLYNSEREIEKLVTALRQEGLG